MSNNDFDAARDLSFERVVDLPPASLWAAWTRPELLMPWFCPRPWTTVECQIDLRPGGLFRTVMRSPEGNDFPNVGSFLEVVPERRLVWSNALGPGFRPVPASALGDFFFFTGIVEFLPEAGGTRYRATVRHGTPEDRQKHADMGFTEGWGKALEQLVESMRGQPH